MIEDLISRVFYTRNAAHIAHWKARGVGSYARHSALGDFYGDIVDSLDTIVEAYQGFFEIIGTVPSRSEKPEVRDIIQLLAEDADWLIENRDELTDENDALENMVDEMSAIYMKALYKLRNLQ